jgi:hypothetical protein
VVIEKWRDPVFGTDRAVTWGIHRIIHRCYRILGKTVVGVVQFGHAQVAGKPRFVFIFGHDNWHGQSHGLVGCRTASRP